MIEEVSAFGTRCPFDSFVRSNHVLSYSACIHVTDGGDIHTNRYLKSFACGRDIMHLVIAKKGSIVPKHSAMSLCRPFASRSMLMWNFNMTEPDTNRVYCVC